MLRRMKGFTLIELLIVVAIIAILAAIAVPNFLEAQTRSKVARVRGDQRTITIALETYYLDQNAYPAQDSSDPGAGYGCNVGIGKSGPGFKVPTFRIKKDSVDALITLTTPVAYITTYFPDPFADTKGLAFAYSVSRYGTGYILWSFGPDADENDASNNPTSGAGGDIPVSDKAKWTNQFPYVEETTYNASASNNIVLNMFTYDPSNGTSSSGDVYRTKQ